IEQIKKAAAIGADAALVITPSFYRPAITQEVLVAHYLAVADESPIPVVLYSMPDLTDIKIEPQTAATLSTHQNIVGIKDSSSDLAGFSETVRTVSENFSVLTGNGTVLRDALRAGARGAILAVGCIAVDYCVEIHRLAKTAESGKAAAIQEKLTPLALAVTTRYGIGGLKAAMDMIGFAGGSVRAPLKPAGEEAWREIASLLDALRAIELSKTEANAEFAGMKKP
ncbi:MAG: dihydrodipicolinate synthase family protein, partial [Pyrinomonadaceae bacterium]